jgi:curved DNA-binding protein CbpA
MSGDHYRALGVAPDAPDDAVKDAFRRLALALHPDKAGAAGSGSPGGAAAAFAAVQRAWEVLREPAARRQYDAERAAAGSGWCAGAGGSGAPAGFQHATHTSGAITVDDLVDLDAAGTAGVFHCRCGDALHVAVRCSAHGQPAPPRVVSCSSCSLRYHVELLQPPDDDR